MQRMPSLNSIIQGDTLEVLKLWPDNFIDCVITSPPYYGLRDYLVDGQIGLEKTLDEYLGKMLLITEELKRVLKPTGTMFWNHGDSYGGTQPKSKGDFDPKYPAGRNVRENPPTKDFMPKCLLLQNYRLVQEMTTRQAKVVMLEKNRQWLAAMIDGEGSVALHRRYKNRLNPTYGALLAVHNTNKLLIDEVVRITQGLGSVSITKKSRNKPLYRWQAMSNDAKDILGDVYPNIIGKRGQAKIVLNCPTSGKEAEISWQDIKRLNNGKSVFGKYKEPNLDDRKPWTARNVLIWWKPNCMPSSVKDRFTVDFEPVFFFSKSKKYWFEQQFEESKRPNDIQTFGANKGREYKPSRNDPNFRDGNEQWGRTIKINANRSKRSVWKIPTQPFKEAHFATFPEKLIEPMIKSGCPEMICKKCGKAREKIFEYKGGTIGKSWHDHSSDTGKGMMQYGENSLGANQETYERIDKGYSDCGCSAGWDSGIVLDPFFGAGTTGVVAKKFNRRWIGIELNQKYIAMAENRLKNSVYQMGIDI